MVYVMGFNLSPRDKKILAILLSYRGVTAKQLTILITEKSDFTLSEEKSIYNSLRKLKKQGLIIAHKLQETVANGSMYYLSPKGYSLTLDLLNIEADQKGEGWLPYVSSFETNFADLPYEIYSPPKKQTAHHLMLVEVFLQLLKHKDEIPEGVPHRSNLYSSRDYYHNDGKHLLSKKFRPDGEILINSNRYTIEIDRAMETHEQLVQKLEVYKSYFEHCKRTGEPNTIKGIIFVVEDRRRMHGIKKRWASLLAAYVKVLYPEWREVPLILTSMSSITETILQEKVILNDTFEDIKNRTNARLEKLPHTSEIKHYVYNAKEEVKYAYSIGFNVDASFSLYNSSVCHEYDTRMFTTHIDLQNNLISGVTTDSKKHLEGYNYCNARTLVWYSDDRRQPVLVDLTPYKVHPQLSGVFKKAAEHIDFYCDKTTTEHSE